MSRGIVTVIAGNILMLLLSSDMIFSQPAGEQSLMIMFYNVENLFDIYDDPATDDDEFLPRSERRWNYKRYKSKINSLYKTISAAGEWTPPAIVALCEVENRKVIEDVVYGTNLSKFNYDILHQDSPDPRGIDVCLIYRKEIVDIISRSYFIPETEIGGGFKTRSVLYARCLAGGDTVHLFINHWPSRRGGVLAGESVRENIAQMLRYKADSIANSTERSAKIIIMGDFNATPNDNVVRMLSDPYGSGMSMINLSETQMKGTYRYRGIWEMIDQVIVSDRLLFCKQGLYTTRENFRIFDADFLLKKDPVYPGKSPYSTWAGFMYQGGFSDHLPVLLELRVRQGVNR